MPIVRLMAELMAEFEESLSFLTKPKRCMFGWSRHPPMEPMEPPMTDQPFRIVFALFPGVTQLDFTGPLEVLSRLPGAEVMLASREGGALAAENVTFAGLRR